MPDSADVADMGGKDTRNRLPVAVVGCPGMADVSLSACFIVGMAGIVIVSANYRSCIGRDGLPEWHQSL